MRNCMPRTECPELIKKAAGDEVYYFCNIVDKPCLLEYGNSCETYNEFLKEEDINESNRVS